MADEGNPPAQSVLGVAYYEGRGVRKDFAEAAKWFLKAAEQGIAQAQGYLGLMYQLGQGVPQDFAESVKWYRKAAEQGDVDAQWRFGVMYNTGRGVPQDFVQAYMWVNIAASRASGAQQFVLAAVGQDCETDDRRPDSDGAGIGEGLETERCRERQMKNCAIPRGAFLILESCVEVQRTQSIHPPVNGSCASGETKIRNGEEMPLARTS